MPPQMPPQQAYKKRLRADEKRPQHAHEKRPQQDDAIQQQQLTTDEKDAGEALLHLKRRDVLPADMDFQEKMQRSDNTGTVRDFLKRSAIGMQKSNRGYVKTSHNSRKSSASAKAQAGRIARNATTVCKAQKKRSSAPSQQKEALRQVSLPLQTYLVPQYYMPFIPPPPHQSVLKGVRTGEGSRLSMPHVDRDPRVHMNSAATQACQTYTAPQVLTKNAETQTESAVQASIKSAATQTSSTTQPAGKTLRDMILTKHWHTCKVCGQDKLFCRFLL